MQDMKCKISVAILVAILISVAKTEYECDSPYILYEKYCYRFSTDIALYDDVLKTCGAENGHLVSIHNAATNDFIYKHAKGEVLIGLHYDTNMKSFNWSDGSKLDYTNYVDGFVTFVDYFGSCARMNADGKWANAECDMDDFKYVCRKQALDVAVSNGSVCPDPNNKYIDHGELTSPGYPGTYDGSASLNCSYALLAKTGHFINLKVEVANLGGDHIYVYKDLSTAKTNLVTTITRSSVNVSTVIHTNRVLVVFSGKGSGEWKLRWDSVETKAACEFAPTSYIIDDWCFVYSTYFTHQDVSGFVDYCIFYNRAELISIHNQEEDNLLASMLKLSSGVVYQLIGLKYYAEGELRWLDGTAVDYTNFADSYAPDSTPAHWIFTYQGKWINGNPPGNTVQNNCKKHVSVIPMTPAECPDPNAIFENAGEVVSPGYPAAYAGEDLFECRIHLRAKLGYTIYIYFQIINGYDGHQVIKAYNGWEETEGHRISTIQSKYKLVASSNGTNTMLIVHSAVKGAWWAASWYSTKDPSYVPARQLSEYDEKLHRNEELWKMKSSQSSQCAITVMPASGSGWSRIAISSPNYPSVYPANQDCIYYSNSTVTISKGQFWLINFARLKIAHEDYIRLIDLRTNTIFATTDTNIREGLSLATDFEFAVEFHSGNVQTDDKFWHVTLHNHM